MTEIHNLPRSSLLKRVYWYEKKYGPYVKKKGSHNWKNLFRKPTLQEWTVLFMLIMSLVLWWAYNQDMESCREIVKECNNILNPILNYSDNWGNFSFNGSAYIQEKFGGVYLVNLSEEVNNAPNG